MMKPTSEKKNKLKKFEEQRIDEISKKQIKRKSSRSSREANCPNAPLSLFDSNNVGQESNCLAAVLGVELCSSYSLENGDTTPTFYESASASFNSCDYNADRSMSIGATPSAFSRLNSQTIVHSLSTELPELSLYVPEHSKRRRAIMVDFDGTLIPYVRVICMQLGLSLSGKVNPIYHVLLLMDLTKKNKPENGVTLVLKEKLLKFGCDNNTAEYLMEHDLMHANSADDSSFIVNTVKLSSMRLEMLSLASRHCREFFVILNKCHELGRLVIVSNGGLYWIDQMLSFMLDALYEKRLSVPRWHEDHNKLSDDEMYKVARSGVSFLWPNSNEFTYPKSTPEVWRIPVICMKNKVTVFSEIVDAWNCRDLISIGDGCLEFHAAGGLFDRKNLAVRRVHFGYLDPLVPPDLSSAHFALFRELPNIVESLEGQTCDIVVTIPNLRTSLIYNDGVITEELDEPLHDVQIFKSLPSIPLFIRTERDVQLVTHVKSENGMPSGKMTVLRSHSFSATS